MTQPTQTTEIVSMPLDAKDTKLVEKVTEWQNDQLRKLTSIQVLPVTDGVEYLGTITQLKKLVAAKEVMKEDLDNFMKSVIYVDSVRNAYKLVAAEVSKIEKKLKAETGSYDLKEKERLVEQVNKTIESYIVSLKHTKDYKKISVENGKGARSHSAFLVKLEAAALQEITRLKNEEIDTVLRLDKEDKRYKGNKAKFDRLSVNEQLAIGTQITESSMRRLEDEDFTRELNFVLNAYKSNLRLMEQEKIITEGAKPEIIEVIEEVEEVTPEDTHKDSIYSIYVEVSGSCEEVKTLEGLKDIIRQESKEGDMTLRLFLKELTAQEEEEEDDIF